MNSVSKTMFKSFGVGEGDGGVFLGVFFFGVELQFLSQFHNRLPLEPQ